MFKYTYNTNLFKVDSSTKFYLLGLILADGYIDKHERRMELALKEADKPFLEMIRDLICPGKPLNYKQRQKAYKLTVDNVDIVSEIMLYINNRQKSKFLIFPYGIPDEYLLDFIRGYMDGDGTIGVARARRKFEDGIKHYYGLRLRFLGTKQFLQGLEFNLRRLGVTKRDVRVHRKGQENCYYIEFNFKSAKDVLHSLYEGANIKLERKYQVYNLILNSDSDYLAERYATNAGRYNTHSSLFTNKDEGIVGPFMKVEE